MPILPRHLIAACACAVAARTLAAQTPTGPERTRPPAIDEPTLVARLGRSLDSLGANEGFSGVVVLSRGSHTVFERAVGAADRETGRMNTVATAFNVGSISKIFTATAIRQLAAAGRIDLDAPLATYWPDYPNADVARRVTIRQLLQHRSGIGGNIFDAPPGGTRHDVRHNRDFVPLFAGEPLAFEPGSRQQYSNAGYVVLGEVIARVSGEDYYAYVRRHVYEPAGMRETAYYAVDSLPAHAALGYTTAREPEDTLPGPLHPNTATLPGRGSAAGGGYSTAADLMRFLQALRRGAVPSGPPAGLGIAGGAPGLNGVVEGMLPGDYDLVVLANLDPPAAEAIARRVRGWLGGGGD